ncbi:hypothetical protein BIFGAL_02521 [Bifidobacterium gallicum DSM 20093 = LMG 11596]|uniref:Uncharacterized protein n=1 Tax=Bifidobacterium gallicum DSM 20093 = LMG 11596 TaxID=561180 RepID=D1NRX1_9BIFI|nr:hypothetical protein BIFGAL_02521 [Bifidobacterium gallicum DSM 20093 = LMG 11596]
MSPSSWFENIDIPVVAAWLLQAAYASDTTTVVHIVEFASELFETRRYVDSYR